MLLSTQKEIRGIGPVFFERSQRAKHLNITIRPSRGIRIAVPYGMSFKKAEKIVLAKKAWILKKQAKMKLVSERFTEALKNRPPLKKAVARKALIDRLESLAGRYEFDYRRVFIRNQKSRWGSCSSKNNINLNIQLTLLPDELMDYVILHELLHTRIKNHSREFWKELDRLVCLHLSLREDRIAKKMHSRLKDYGLAVLD